MDVLSSVAPSCTVGRLAVRAVATAATSGETERRWRRRCGWRAPPVPHCACPPLPSGLGISLTCVAAATGSAAITAAVASATTSPAASMATASQHKRSSDRPRHAHRPNLGGVWGKQVHMKRNHSSALPLCRRPCRGGRSRLHPVWELSSHRPAADAGNGARAPAMESERPMAAVVVPRRAQLIGTPPDMASHPASRRTDAAATPFSADATSAELLTPAMGAAVDPSEKTPTPSPPPSPRQKGRHHRLNHDSEQSAAATVPSPLPEEPPPPTSTTPLPPSHPPPPHQQRGTITRVPH